MNKKNCQLTESEQLLCLCVAIVKSKYSKEDILTKKVTPEILLRKINKIFQITPDKETDEEMLVSLREILYLALVCEEEERK